MVRGLLIQIGSSSYSTVISCDSAHREWFLSPSTAAFREPPMFIRAIKKAAAELAKEFIEKHLQPVLDTYGKVAIGYIVHKVMTTKAGTVVEWEEFVYDSQILKHYMD